MERGAEIYCRDLTEALPRCYLGICIVIPRLHILTNEKINIYKTNAELMPNTKMIGREKEKAVIESSLRDALESRGRTVLVSGEAGIGKTTLVEHLKSKAEALGMTVLLGETTVQDTLVPYLPFQRALSSIIDTELFQSEEFVHFDEVFLISKIGLLISHVSRSPEEGMDEDILGSMLTAVQDFVKDSFGDGGTESHKGGLGKLEYMNTKIFIEHGDLVYLAVVTSGEEHPDMKQEIRRCLAEIESTFYDLLVDWDGDIDSLTGTEILLGKIVDTKFRVKRQIDRINLSAERTNVQNKILETLISSAAQHGLLLILEDIHWADASTILAIPFLARNLLENKIALCITYREDAVESNIPELRKILDDLASDRKSVKNIILEPIDDESLKLIVSNALDGGTPPDELLTNLRTESDGNPFFIKEAISTLTSDGTLIKDGDVWVLTHGPKSSLPHSVFDIVSRRLDGLSLDCLRFVEYGAVLGRRFQKSMLCTAFSLDATKVEETINTLVNLNIFIEPSDEELMFQHSKTQEVIYSELSNRWRKTLHYHAGEVIESAYKGNYDKVIYSLAYHYSNARDTDKGIAYSILAGNKAIDNLAPRESIKFYENAAELMELSGRIDSQTYEIKETLGELHELDGNYIAALFNYDWLLKQPLNMPVPVRVTMKKGRVHQSQGNYDEAISIFEEGIKLATESGNAFWKAKINGYLGKIYLRKGIYDRALELQSDYLRESMVLSAPQELGQAYMNVGGVYYHLKDYSQAISNWLKAGEFFEKAKYNQGIAFINDNLGGVYLMMGKLEESLKYYEKAEEMMNKIGDVKGLSMVLNNIGALYDDLGEYQTSLKLYERSLQIKKRIGDNVGVANVFNNIGSAYFNMGHFEEALKNYHENLAIMQKIGDIWGIAQALNNIAEAEIEMGMHAESLEHCVKSLELAQKHSFKEIQTTVYRLMGSLSAENKDDATSTHYFDLSLKLATEIEEPQKIGMLHLAQARAHRKTNEPEKAIDSYARALDIYDKMDMKTMSAKIRQEMQFLVDDSLQAD